MQFGSRTSCLLRKVCRKVFRENGDVVQPFTQRRQRQRNDVEPVIKIGAESALFDQRLKRYVGSGDHPDIHGNGAHFAKSLHFPLLQYAQKLRLQVQRHFADFIEQQRSAICQFKFSGLRHRGAGEGSSGMAEQFAFEKLLWHCRTVDGNERFVAAVAALVNKARQKFLTSAAFGFDQHVGVGLSPQAGLDPEPSSAPVNCQRFLFASGSKLAEDRSSAARG